MWLIGDLDSLNGLRTVKDALRHSKTEGCATRLSFIHVPRYSNPQTTRPLFSTTLYQLLSVSALQTIAPHHLLSVVEEAILQHATPDNLDTDGVILSEATQHVLDGTPLHAFTSSGWGTTDLAAAAEFWSVGSEIARTLGLKEDRSYVLVNGRVSVSTGL